MKFTERKNVVYVLKGEKKKPTKSQETERLRHAKYMTSSKANGT